MRADEKLSAFVELERHAQTTGVDLLAIDTPLLGREKYKPHVGRGLIN